MAVEILIVFTIIFLGSFIQGISGFGFGIVAMSFMPFFFTVKDSTLLVVALAVLLSFSISLQLRKHIHWRSIGWILLFAVIGRSIGFVVLHNYGELPVLRVILGVFLLGVVVYLLTSPKPNVNQTEIPIWIPMLMGFLGGVVGGIFAVGGPFFVFYFLMVFPADKFAYTANLQIVFFITSMQTVFLHSVSGDYTLDIVLYIFVGVVAVLTGSRFGVQFLHRVSTQQVKKLAAIVVAIAAVSLIFFGGS